MTTFGADTTQALATHHDLLSWYEEFSSAVTYADHIILSGNIRDLYPSFTGQGDLFPDFDTTLWDLLRSQGFRALVHYDPVAGLTIHQTSSDAEADAVKDMDIFQGKPGTQPDWFVL